MATKTTPSATPARKGSASTEVVLGQAAQKISKAVAELNSAADTVNKLVSKSEELTLQVANKETQIAELHVQFEEKARQAEVEFELTMKANAEKLVTDYLREGGKVAVSTSDLEALKQELTAVKNGAEAETNKAVAIVANTLKSQYESEVKLLQSENRAVAVENTSKIAVLEDKNKFLDQQVTKLYAQLDAERAAGTERARAGSVGAINFGSDSNRK